MPASKPLLLSIQPNLQHAMAGKFPKLAPVYEKHGHHTKWPHRNCGQREQATHERRICGNRRRDLVFLLCALPVFFSFPSPCVRQTSTQLKQCLPSFLLLPLLNHDRSVGHATRPATAMSGPQRKKKTVAQLRAEKEQRERDFDEGKRLAYDVSRALKDLHLRPATYESRHDHMNALLVQANRAASISPRYPSLPCHPYY